MKKRSIALVAAILSLSACHMMPKSVQTHQVRPMTTNQPTKTLTSRHNFDDTVVRLTDTITQKGMTIFAVIDHQAAAQKAGLTMQPAKVIIFGNPKVGTPLMVKDPSFALKLPLKVLVTEVAGQTQVTFLTTEALIADSQINYDEVANTLAGAEKLIQTVVTQ